jgi:tRNA A64-2'-O-ribosylphosphate transferase
LKPNVFHQHRDRLLSTPKQDLPSVIEEVKASSAKDTAKLNSSHLASTTEIPANSGLILGVTLALKELEPSKERMVLQLTRLSAEEMPDPASSDDHLFFRIPKSKKGETYYFGTVLPAGAEAASKARSEGKEVLVVDDDGKDVSVGVMVALSWIFIDDQGSRRSGPVPTGEQTRFSRYHCLMIWMYIATKSDTRTRLQWILDKRPGANPSRSTLQRVNEFLMSPRRSQT